MVWYAHSHTLHKEQVHECRVWESRLRSAWCCTHIHTPYTNKKYINVGCEKVVCILHGIVSTFAHPTRMKSTKKKKALWRGVCRVGCQKVKSILMYEIVCTFADPTQKNYMNENRIFDAAPAEVCVGLVYSTLWFCNWCILLYDIWYLYSHTLQTHAEACAGWKWVWCILRYDIVTYVFYCIWHGIYIRTPYRLMQRRV